MKRRLAILVCTLLSAVSQAGTPLPGDCRVDAEITVKVKFYESPRRLQAAFLSAANVNTAQNLRVSLRNGFATKVRAAQRDYYVLHVPAIRHERDTRRIETLGHELLHALCGAWHEPKDDLG